MSFESPDVSTCHTRCGDDRQAAPYRETSGALLSTLAKAYRWQEQIESREYEGLEDLTPANGVDRTYVGRILRLMSLAPEIVEAILEGNEPEAMSLAKLRTNLSATWALQVWPHV